MNKENKVIWDILTPDEKSALMLSLGHGKSTWEAGEIMAKAHYKYLEIQARANCFFKMFSAYFEITKNKRIPEDCHINPYFRDYIIATIFERKDPRKVIKEMGNNPFVVTSAKERIFKECLDLLENHENPQYQDLYDLIIEFDRWNNWRILPPSLQEPSAFKRRNKSRLIKHLKNLSSLDIYHIKRFENKFKAKKGQPKLFIAVLSKEYEGGYEVIKIARKPDIVDYITKHLRLYIFKEYVDADMFGYLVNKYLKDKNKDCKIGQKFWPEYRKTIETADNYLGVNNIIPRRKHLEKAFRDMDEIIIRRNTKKSLKIADPQRRVKTEDIWVI